MSLLVATLAASRIARIPHIVEPRHLHAPKPQPITLRGGHQTALLEADSEVELDDMLDGANDTLVVVGYVAAWCVPCQKLKPLIEQLAARYAKHVTFITVDVDSAPELARTAGRSGT